MRGRGAGEGWGQGSWRLGLVWEGLILLGAKGGRVELYGGTRFLNIAIERATERVNHLGGTGPLMRSAAPTDRGSEDMHSSMGGLKNIDGFKRE